MPRIKIEVDVPEGKYCNIADNMICSLTNERFTRCLAFENYLLIYETSPQSRFLHKCPKCLKACKEAEAKNRED